MIAYNKTWLRNLFVQQTVDALYAENCFAEAEKDAIHTKYAAPFYSPNLFIRTGLFILTYVIMIFSLGLLFLVSVSALERTYSIVLILFSTLLFGMLEYMIRKKQHYRSGVDDALLSAAFISLVSALELMFEINWLTSYILVFFISLFCTLRYADRFITAVWFFSLIGICFFLCTGNGNTLKALVPFVIMAVSLLIYIAVKKMDLKRYFEYAGCMLIIQVLSLTMLYVAGNYWVVRELSNSMFYLQLVPGQSIPYGIFFWIFTAIIPVIYIIKGLQKKDVVLLRVGLLLVAAMVFTFRYYYALLSPETAMVIAGMLLISIAWAVTRYLRIPKYGFTLEQAAYAHLLDNLHIESLVLAETFSQQPDTGATKFGGGSFDDARLKSVIKDGNKFLLIPKVGSVVLVAKIENSDEYVVIAVEEITEHRINIDNVKFIVDDQGLSTAINAVEFNISEDGFLVRKGEETLKRIFDDLFKAIEKITVNTNVGPSSIPINVASFEAIKLRVANFLQ